MKLAKNVKNEIEKAILNNESILIVGETGTGKTTLLNTIIKHIPENKEVAYIKSEVNELDIPEHNHSIIIDGDFKDAMKVDPDIIIIDEMRMAKLKNPKRAHSNFDQFVRTLNCGVSGITTIHSSNAEQAINNILNKMSDEQSESSNLELIQRAFDLIIVMGIEVHGDDYIRKIIDIKKVSKDSTENKNDSYSIQLLDI